MGRATGASVRAYLKEEASYGVNPGGNFFQIPIISVSLGMDQDLQSDPIIGRGRDPYTPQRDVKNVTGDIAVPVDYHNIGFWLSGLLGAPATTTVAATGTITFADNPSNGDTITLNGATWTFVSGSPSTNETQIQGSLAATLEQLVTDLNGSANASIDDATYTENDTQLIITHDTAGTAGNSYTLAASADTASGPTLTGGGYRHRFVSGLDALPSWALEVGHPNVPAYFMNLGVAVNSMTLPLSTSGLAQATFGLIGQDEQRSVSSGAGTPDSLNSGNVDSFSQFQGLVKRNGGALANIESVDISYSNNLDPVRVIRSDGLISGADPGLAALTGSMTARFDSTQLRQDAENDTELELQFGFQRNGHTKLLFTAHNVHLPIRKHSVEGPAGIRATYDWQAAFDAAQGRMMTVDLHNDYAGTAYPS